MDEGTGEGGVLVCLRNSGGDCDVGNRYKKKIYWRPGDSRKVIAVPPPKSQLEQGGIEQNSRGKEGSVSKRGAVQIFGGEGECF